jgi:hypothetical protein
MDEFPAGNLSLVARMAKSFTLVDGKLYKHAASGVLQ